MRYSYRIIL